MLFSVTRGWVGVQFPGKKALRNTWMAPNIESFYPRQLRYALKWNKISTCYNKPKTLRPHKMWTLEHFHWTLSTLMAWASDAFKSRHTSQTIFQRSPMLWLAKGKPGRPPTTWITTIQKDPTERGIYINLCGINAIKELESMCHKWSCGMESKMQRAGNPRDVTTESVNV